MQQTKTGSLGCFFFNVMNECLHFSADIRVVFVKLLWKKKRQGIQPVALSGWRNELEVISFCIFWYGNSLVAVLITYAVDVYCINNGGPYNSCWWCLFESDLVRVDGLGYIVCGRVLISCCDQPQRIVHVSHPSMIFPQFYNMVPFFLT